MPNSLKHELWCYAIATKRYALYRPTDHGPELVATLDDAELADEGVTVTAGEEAVVGDWSEHGLGLYLDPTDDQRRIGNPPRRAWTQQAWQWILDTALQDPRTPLPAWSDRYAVTQFNVSTPNHTGWFHATDTGGHLEGKPRPFAFGLLGHVDPFATNWITAHPAAPYESDPNRWPGIPWYDRHSSHPLKVIGADHLGHDPSALADVITARTVPLRTIGNILHTHVLRPEHKSIPHHVAADGANRGELVRRAVQSAAILTDNIGKRK